MKDDNRLPPIPTPFANVWRELRIQVIPIVVFVLVVCGAVYVWRTLPGSSDIKGVGEGVRSVVTSPRVGILQRLEVQPYQWVKAGDPIATILPFDPNAQLDLVQLDTQLIRLQLEPSVAERSAMNYEQVRFEALKLGWELAMAKAELERAEAALKRNQGLVKENLVSQDTYELSLRDRNLFQAEVNIKTEALGKIDSRLQELQALGDPGAQRTNQVTRGIMDRLQERIAAVQTNWAPITLVSPINGQVHMISRQENEYLVEGEPLVTIVSPRSDRIVAYLRQPFNFEPMAGMPVDVLLQNKERQRFSSQIAQVGAQMEAITNGLAYVQAGTLVDMGLPIVVAVPANVQLRPGEVVNIVLRSQRANPFTRNQSAAVNSSKGSLQLQ
jgi:multidrug resistance efflux pump